MEKEIGTSKKKTKDSVFVHLFSDVNNVLKLYKELHPEDEIVTKEDIVVKTLETVFINSLYNDLGFLVNKGNSAANCQSKND